MTPVILQEQFAARLLGKHEDRQNNCQKQIYLGSPLLDEGTERKYEPVTLHNPVLDFRKEDYGNWNYKVQGTRKWKPNAYSVNRTAGFQLEPYWCKAISYLLPHYR